MIRSALLLTLAALGFNAMSASAAEVQVAYKGVVTYASGPQASSFAAGQEISARYVVETTATDSDPSTTTGIYPIGLRELRISIPDAGLNVVTGVGGVVTSNDQVYDYYSLDLTWFNSYATSGELSGLPVILAQFDFGDYEYLPNRQPAMLASDAIPTAHLSSADYSFFTFVTSAGNTIVYFQAEADEPVTTCASEGYKGTQLAWCKNICENGLTGQMLDTWIHRWIGKYRDLPYCAAKK